MEYNLVKELENYSPSNEVEKENVKAVLKFLKNNNNCYDRSNLDGHITAGALVVSKSGKILLNHHKKSGMWFQFGGHCDNDTDTLNSARREVFEECGLKDLPLISGGIFDVDVQDIDENVKKNEPKHIHYDINFLLQTDVETFTLSNESTEIKWCTIAEAKEQISKDDIGTNRMISKYEKLKNNE